MQAPLNSERQHLTGFEHLPVFTIDWAKSGNLEGSLNQASTYEATNHLATSLFGDSDRNELDRLLKECRDLINGTNEVESKSYLSLSNYEADFSNIIKNREYAKAAELITFLRRELPGFEEAPLINQFVLELRKHIKELYEGIKNNDVSNCSKLFSVANWQAWDYLDPALLSFGECFQLLDCSFNRKEITAEIAEKYKGHAYFLFEILQKKALRNNFDGIQDKIQLFFESYPETKEDPLKLNYHSKNKLLALKTICAHRTKSSFTNEEILNLEKEYFHYFTITKFPLLTKNYFSFLIEHNLIEKLLTLFKEKNIKEDQLPSILNILYHHQRWDVFLTLHNDQQSILIEYTPTSLYKFYYLLNIACRKLSNNTPFDPSTLENQNLKLIAEAAISVYDKNYASMQIVEEKLISLAEALRHQDFEFLAYDFRYMRLMALGKFKIAFEEIEKRYLSGKLVSPKTFAILGFLNHVPNQRFLWAVYKLPSTSFLYHLSATLLKFSITRKETRLNLEILDKLFYDDEPYDYGTSFLYLNALTLIGNWLNQNEDQELKFETSEKAVVLARNLLKEDPFSCEIYIFLMFISLRNSIDHLPDIIEEGLYFVSDKLAFISKSLAMLHKHETQSACPNRTIRTSIFKLILAAYSFKPMPKQAYDLVASYSKVTQVLLSKPFDFNLSNRTLDLTGEAAYEWNHVEYLSCLVSLVNQFFSQNNFIQGILLIPKKFPFQLPSDLEQNLFYLNHRAEQFLENKVKELQTKNNENNPLHLIAIAEELPFFINFKTYSIEALSLKIVAQISLKHFDNARNSLIPFRNTDTLSTYHLLRGDLSYEEGKYEEASHHYDRLLGYQSDLSENTLFKIAFSKLKSRPNDPSIPEKLLEVILKDNSFLTAYELIFDLLEMSNTEVSDVIAKLPRNHEFYTAAIKFYFSRKDYEEVVRNSLEYESIENIPGKEHYAFLIGEFYYRSLIELGRVNETLEKRKETSSAKPKSLDLFFELHYLLDLENESAAIEILRLYKQQNPQAQQNPALMELFSIVVAKCYFLGGHIDKANSALQKLLFVWSPFFIFMMSLLTSNFDKAMRMQSIFPYVDPKKMILTYWRYLADPKALATLQDPHKVVESYKKIILSDPAMDTIEHHYLFISFLKKFNPSTPLIWEQIRDYLTHSPRIQNPKEVHFLVKVIECINRWRPEESLKLSFFFLEKCPKKELIFKKIISTIRMLRNERLNFSLEPYIKIILNYSEGFPSENYSEKRAKRRLATIKNADSSPPFLVPAPKVPQLASGNRAVKGPAIHRTAPPRSTKPPVFLDLTNENEPTSTPKPVNPTTISTSRFMRQMERDAVSIPPIAGPFIAGTHLPRQTEARNEPLIATQMPIRFTIPSGTVFEPSVLQPMDAASYSESSSQFTQNETIPSFKPWRQPMETGTRKANEEPLDLSKDVFQASSEVESSSLALDNLDDFGLETLGNALLAEVQECVAKASEMPEDGLTLQDPETYPNLELFDSLSESDKELASLLETHAFKHLLISSKEEGLSLPNSRIELYRLYESLSYEGRACLLTTLKLACQKFNSWLENDRIPFIKSSLQKQNGVFAFSYHSKPIGELLYAIVLELNKNQIEANNAIIESVFFYFISHILRVTKASNGFCYGEHNKKAIQRLNPKLWSLIEKSGEMNSSRFPPKEKMALAVVALTYKNLLSELLSHFTSNIESFFKNESYDSSVLHSRGIDVSFIYRQKEGIFTYYSSFLFDSNGFPLSTFSPSKLDFNSLSNYSLPIPQLGKARFEKGELSKISDHLITGSNFPKILFIFSNKNTLAYPRYLDEGLCFPYLENFASNTGQRTSVIASLLSVAEASSEWLLTDLKYKNYLETPPKRHKNISLQTKTPSKSAIPQVGHDVLLKSSEKTSQKPIKAKLLTTSNALENTHKRKAEALKKPASSQQGTINHLSIEEGVLEFKKLINSIEKNNLVSFEKVRDISYLLREYLENQMVSNLPIVLYPKSSDSEDALILNLLIHPIEGKNVRILYRTDSHKCQETTDYFKDAILEKKLEYFNSTFASIEKEIRHNRHAAAQKKCVTLNYIISVILDQARTKAAKTRFERTFVEKVREISQKLSSISRTHSFKLYNISNVNDLFVNERKAFLSQFKKPFKSFLLTSPEDLVSATDPKAPLFVSNIENHSLHADAKDIMAIFNANNYTIYKHKTLHLQSITNLHADFLLDLLLQKAFLTSLSLKPSELPKMLYEMRQKVNLSIKQIEHSPHAETKNQAYQCLKQWFFLHFEFISKIRSSFFDFNKDYCSFVNLIITLNKEEVTQETILNLIKNFLREQKVPGTAGIAFLEERKKDSNFDQEFQSLLEEHIEPKPKEGPHFPGRWVLQEERGVKRPLTLERLKNLQNKGDSNNDNRDFDSYYERNLESPSRKKASGYAEIAKLEPSKRTKRQTKFFKRETESKAPTFPSNGSFPSWSQNDFQSSIEGLSNPIFYQKNQKIFNTTEYLRLAEEALQAKKEKYRYLLEEKARKESQNSLGGSPKEEENKAIETKDKEALAAKRLELIYNDLQDIADEIYNLTKTVAEVKFSLLNERADLSLFNLSCEILKFNSILRGEEPFNFPELKSLKEKIIEMTNDCLLHLSNQHAWLKENHYIDQRSLDDKPSSPYDELQLSYEGQKLAFRQSMIDLFSIFPLNLAYDASDRSPLNTSYYLFFMDILTDSLMLHFEKLKELKEQESKCSESDPTKIFLMGQIETRKALCSGNFKELDFYLARWNRLYQQEPEKLKEIQVYFEKAQEVMRALYT